MAQTHFVKEQLEAKYSDLKVDILSMTTQGDQMLEHSLAKVGGKGLFVKELEKALLSGEADIAVHSCKDIPMELPEGLCLSAILKRDDPCDALVSNQYQSFADLPDGAIIGTSSLRRQVQLLHQRPDFQIKLLRGNANTRLSKLDAGEYDAIIIAAAGLTRIGQDHRMTGRLPVVPFIPAVAQGALAIECRQNDEKAHELLAFLRDADTTQCVEMERAVSRALGASCNLPLAAYATREGGLLNLMAMVASPDASHYLVVESAQEDTLPVEELANKVVDQLKEQGAEEILNQVRDEFNR